MPPIDKGPPPQLQIKSTSHIEKRNFSVLYQGPGGTGKTHAMATWPSPFFLYFDNNFATLAKFPDIPYAIVQDWREVQQTWLPAIEQRRLSELVQGFEIEGQHPYKDYQVETLAIDSLTFFVNMNVLEIGKGGARDMGYDGWDRYYARIHQLLNAATGATSPMNRDPGAECYNVVVSVHEDIKTSEQGVVQKIVPSVQGKMQTHLAAFFDCHILMDTRQKKVDGATRIERFGRTTPFEKRLCKGDQIGGGRYNLLPDQVDPTYPGLVKAWGMDGA